MSRVEGLVGIVLNTRDAVALSRFYVDAFDGQAVDGGLRLGGMDVALRRVDDVDGDAPSDVPGWSPRFQHFAIVVSDMSEAMRRLSATPGWSAISLEGPQRLPRETGGVTAFKFRDPEGHPLELLFLPDAPHAADAGTFVRIDHAAISVADVARSLAFYADLGLHVASRSLNVGPAQQRLDAIVDAEVDVVGLASDASTTPHIELLGYRGEHDRRGIGVAALDAVLATRLVLTVANRAALERIDARHAGQVVQRSDTRLLLRDPDGHLLELVLQVGE